MTGMLPGDDHLNPDCRSEKHAACAGDAWCLVTDSSRACECPCHEEAASA